MAVNPLFQKNSQIEQDLFQSLVNESITVIGHDVYYLPRTLQKLDLILGEDILSKFEFAVPIEMYMDNKEGGEMDLLSKFGLMVKEQIRYQVSVPRWEEVIRDVHGSSGTNTLYNEIRPQEGDLIYEQMTDSLYEIMYVDKENPYYQLGQPYYYTLICELFNYSSEEFVTGVEEIDKMEDDFSLDILQFEMLDENGDRILQENGDSIIIQPDKSPAAPLFDKSDSFNSASDFVDWDARDPFGDFR